MNETPGRKITAEWKDYGPEWKQARRLRSPAVDELTKVGRTAAMWARRNGLRAEWRIRDEGRTLWLRMVPPETPTRSNPERWLNPSEPD